MEYTRRYLMDGLHNLRDLGGYAVPGGITRFGVLLRSDLPWHLTEDDGKRFAALEVRHTLDLRDVDESESMPDELALLRGVTYRQIAMKKVPRAVARNRPGGLSAFDEAFFWGDEYIRMLEDNHPWAKECAEFLAAAEGTVLFHCFTGNQKEAEELLSFDNFVLGIGGVSTFKSSHLREDLPAAVPMNRIILETDSPYMAPVPYRGKRNESAFVIEVLKTLAKAYGVSEEEFAEQTNKNVESVFHF